jgi:hypothetical protein
MPSTEPLGPTISAARSETSPAPAADVEYMHSRRDCCPAQYIFGEVAKELTLAGQAVQFGVAMTEHIAVDWIGYSCGVRLHNFTPHSAPRFGSKLMS